MTIELTIPETIQSAIDDGALSPSCQPLEAITGIGVAEAA